MRYFNALADDASASVASMSRALRAMEERAQAAFLFYWITA
jgi:hypothetical protein